MKSILSKITSFLLSYLAICCGFISCTETEPVDLDNINPNNSLTVITGFLSPSDTAVKVRISRSVSLFDTTAQSKPIDNAEVIIADVQQNIVRLAYDSTLQLYTAPVVDFEILPGRSYSLSVKIGQNEYSATCVIPDVAIGDVIISSKHTFTNEKRSTGSVAIEFKNPTSNDDFFAIGGSLISMTKEPIKPVLFNPQLFSDITQDSDTLEAFGIYDLAENSVQDLDKIIIRFSIIEENLFNYFRVERVNQLFEDGTIGGTTSTFTRTPSNIIGPESAGVFAGYLLEEIEVSIE